MTATVDFTIYGAYGLIGSLSLQAALRRGHRPRLAGRDPAKLAALAEPLGLSWEVADLDNRVQLDRVLRKAPAVLHTAGPFQRTGRLMVEACLATGTTYVDTNGELGFFAELDSLGAVARAARIALISGAGFGVTAADCLALHVSQKLPDAQSMALIVMPDSAYHSTAVSLSTLAVLAGGGAEIRGGQLVATAVASRVRRVKIFAHEESFASAPLAEVFTASKTTGIPDVTAFVPMGRTTAWFASKLSPAIKKTLGVSWIRRLVENHVQVSPRPPTPEAIASCRSVVWVEAKNAHGQTAVALLTAGEGFHFAADAAVRAIEKAAAVPPGVYTPATAFGPDHILELDGVQRMDVRLSASGG